jgi:hypothetical protein
LMANIPSANAELCVPRCNANSSLFKEKIFTLLQWI